MLMKNAFSISFIKANLNNLFYINNFSKAMEHIRIFNYTCYTCCIFFSINSNCNVLKKYTYTHMIVIACTNFILNYFLTIFLKNNSLLTLTTEHFIS